MYVKIAVVFSDVCKDKGLKYIAMMVPQKRETTPKWEAQVERAFHLPFVDGTLRTAQVMWLYKARCKQRRWSDFGMVGQHLGDSGGEEADVHEGQVAEEEGHGNMQVGVHVHGLEDEQVSQNHGQVHTQEEDEEGLGLPGRAPGGGTERHSTCLLLSWGWETGPRERQSRENSKSWKIMDKMGQLRLQGERPCEALELCSLCVLAISGPLCTCITSLAK